MRAMNSKTKLAIEEGLTGTLLFTAFIYLYYLISVWGISDYIIEGAFKDYVLGPGVHMEALITGLGFGLFLCLVNRLSETQRVRRLSFGFIILIKTVSYLLCLTLVYFIVNIILRLFFLTGEEIAALTQTVTPRFLISAGLWLITSILAINFIFEVRKKIGPGNMIAFLTGRYQHPRLENRIFLFLDLKGSTTIAEQLGPKQYSRFLQHSFHDLTQIVLDFGAQIYQYVGDEVVLTWPTKWPQYRELCMKTFFAFENKLQDRRDWYEKQFGLHPIFRGGVEEGSVTATEVGDIKREIAFHGDPLNTAARLLELCKEFEKDILVSGTVGKALENSSYFSTERQCETILRGKEAAISVYAVFPA